MLSAFRDPQRVETLVQAIKAEASQFVQQHQRLPQIMEVCGGHTHAIYRYGLQQLVGEQVEFLHGPGCPVCVLPKAKIDMAITLAQQPDVILATYGDVMRVPGSELNFYQAKALGCDIRIIYSALDALRLAQQNPDRNVVFFALGFETTMPATALTVQQARRQQTNNFFIFCHHILIMPALLALLQDDTCIIDGFVGPGHVSAIIGSQKYLPICRDYHKPFVIAGFEPVDILQSMWMVLRQLNRNRAEVEIQYSRVVHADGNVVAQGAIADVFAITRQQEWRGLGMLQGSGVTLTPAYARFDAMRRFNVPVVQASTPELGKCDQVLKGRLKPTHCEFFGNRCTPQHPLGALMVSSEGACSACYQHA